MTQSVPSASDVVEQLKSLEPSSSTPTVAVRIMKAHWEHWDWVPQSSLPIMVQQLANERLQAHQIQGGDFLYRSLIGYLGSLSEEELCTTWEPNECIDQLPASLPQEVITGLNQAINRFTQATKRDPSLLTKILTLHPLDLGEFLT